MLYTSSNRQFGKGFPFSMHILSHAYTSNQNNALIWSSVTAYSESCKCAVTAYKVQRTRISFAFSSVSNVSESKLEILGIDID